MPTYGYECKSCKYNFDVFQSIKDEPLKVCPKCGKELRRLINGGGAVIFKGSGFYVNDKRGGDPAKTAEKTGKGAAESTPCAGCAKSETPACPKASGE